MALAGLLALLLAAAPGSAHAWGEDGHRLIARLAYERLSPSVRAEIDRLIAADAADPSPGCPITSVESLSTWSDCVRGIRAYANQSPWHYDNIPICNARAFSCADGNCATAAIARAERTLRNRRADDQARVRALARLVHIVGDIHQPLHAADNGDRGGNSDRVEFRAALPDGLDRPSNLHSAWDTALVATSLPADNATARAEVAALVDANRRQWARGGAADWARQSNRIAAAFIYARWPERLACGTAARAPIVIDDVYVADARPVVRQQLARAVARLTLVLERAV